MKEHTIPDIHNNVQHDLPKTAKQTEPIHNNDRKISWSIKTRNFEKLVYEVSSFQNCSNQICQNWLKAHENEILSYENIAQYQRILIVIEKIIKLTEEIKTIIQCQNLNKLQISEKVGIVVSDCLEIKPDEIIPTASFIDDLGVDSLVWLELVSALERTFSIKIPNETVENILTVQQLIDCISIAQK